MTATDGEGDDDDDDDDLAAGVLISLRWARMSSTTSMSGWMAVSASFIVGAVTVTWPILRPGLAAPLL